MSVRLPVRLCFPALILVCLIASGRSQASDTPLSLDYAVRVTDPASTQLHVSLTLRNVETGQPLVIHSVPAYMANPVARAAGENTVCNFTCRAVAGEERPLEVHEPESKGDSYVIMNPEPELRIDYDLKVDFEESGQTREYPIRIPFMTDTQALLYGNYIFCYPDSDKETPGAVGRALSIHVTFDLPPGLQLWGVGQEQTLHSIYQLMSLQFGWGAEAIQTLRTSGINVSLVFQKESEFAPDERVALQKAVSVSVDEVVTFFGGSPVDHYTFFFFRGDGIGGMEGTFSCQVYIEEGKDVSKLNATDIRMFNSVIAHEFFHTWNPIHVYPGDDPWIKEGFTCYYGEVLSVRAGLLRESDLENNYRYYFRQLERNLVIGSVSLTDPRVWQNEYLNENWRTVTYERGRAVALLLDVAIREKTRNSKSLDDVMRLLFARYKENSYSHDQLIDSVKTATGHDFTDFFTRYVSGTRTPTMAEVQRARKMMDELGIFKQPAELVATALSRPAKSAGPARTTATPSIY